LPPDGVLLLAAAMAQVRALARLCHGAQRDQRGVVLGRSAAAR
jgi:hypothetical protein